MKSPYGNKPIPEMPPAARLPPGLFDRLKKKGNPGAPLHTTTQERIIRPARNVYGSLRLPGDKSISHRYGMLAAFAEGVSRFTNFSTGSGPRFSSAEIR